MAEQFYTILTNTGKAKVANSVLTGQKVNLTTLKVGDSNGAYYNPTETQTNLVHSVYQCNITSVAVDETNSNWINITCAIPSDVGDFYIREAGVFDDGGNLIAIGKYPETYKPVAADGTTKELYIKMTFEVSNSSSVTLKIDPTVILATKSDINTLTTSMNNSIDSINTSLSELANQNILINGDFQIWQRGTSFADGTSCYSADRWYKGYTGLFAKTNGKGVFTSMGSGNSSIDQYIENPSKFAGKTLTASILASLSLQNSASLKINRTVGGVETTLGTININSGVKTSLTVSIPSDVVDTDKLSVKVQFNGSTSLNQTITLQYVKLEFGSLATPFHSRAIGEELELCQRYYEKSYNMSIFAGGLDFVGASNFNWTISQGAYLNMTEFKTRKRTIPTIVMYSPQTGIANAVAVYAGSYQDVTGITTTGTEVNFRCSFSTAISGVGGCRYQYTADAEIY